ncbi:hypothetical protein GQF01_15950 [Paenibacillus sp. 5J-6]|uniref:C1q domain-containing protein n=1 Tax=Paenibacillus silvestris TaxID=2606219 RepID=A0A6L8UZW7_9BACL|nr:hypothetical protein [Paenibacillus silvestris]MZQ83605.1 hypothetical protein [Paenibacillus silvestris]
MPSTTTNLGLYKKNPSTDGNDTFDITTMLNDNWDRLDAQLGAQVADVAPTAVNLVNGLQVVDVPQTAPLENLRITGRTLVNLLGRDGNCEDMSRWWDYQATHAADTTNFTNGKQGIKVTLAASFTAGCALTAVGVSLNPSKYYILLGMIKNGNSSVGGSFSISGQFATTKTNIVSDSSKFNLAYKKLNGITALNVGVNFNVEGIATQYAYADEVRLYEIGTLTEYNAIDAMTASQIAAKYPYVDDVKHVTAPYLIKFGENLLPPFNEWLSLSSGTSITEPYKMILSTTALDQDNYVDVVAIPNQTYTLSLLTMSQTMLVEYFKYGTTYSSIKPDSGVITSSSTTFTTPSDAYIMRVHFYNHTLSIGSFTFDKPMLNLGSTAKPFKPRNDETIAFPNLQLASSTDGTVYDTLFKRDGKYFEEKRFKDIVLDGSLAYGIATQETGFKQFYVSILNAVDTTVATSNKIMKYDGKLILIGVPANVADVFGITSNNVYLSVSSADSGWGDSYIPSTAEIQAYFNGWKMAHLNGTTPYTDTGATSNGAKVWIPVLGFTGSNGSNILPTTQSSAAISKGWTPYKLTYQLATPTFAEVQFESGMSLHEGLNQIELGQGLVVREKANPKFSGGYYIINHIGVSSSQLRNRASRIWAVYKNGRLDTAWLRYSDYSSYGLDRVSIASSMFDPTATYEVTYLALDQYLISAPVQAVTSELARNLKTVVNALCTNQADNEARIAANELLARQIYNVPQKTTANMTLYVDTVNGADNNDGSVGKPFKTIMVAINNIPQIVNHTVTVNVAAGTYAEDVELKGFCGRGRLLINGANNVVSDSYVVNRFFVVSCSLAIFIIGFKATSTTLNNFHAQYSNHIVFDYCKTDVTASTIYAVRYDSSLGRVSNGVFSNKYGAITSSFSSNLYSQSNIGSGNIIGTESANGASVSIFGTYPIGTTTFNTVNTGTLTTNSVLNPWGDNTYASRSRLAAINTAAQNISAGIATKVLYQSENLDNLSEYDNGLSRFTVKNSGTYLISGTLNFSSGMGTGVGCTIFVYANGVAYKTLRADNGSSSSAPMLNFVTQVNFATGSYVEVYVVTSSATVIATNTTLDITQIA